MTHCWNQDPARRPSFKQLVSVLAGMVSDNADYLQVRIIEEKYSCYNYRKFVLSGEHADHKVRQPDISATDNAIGGRGRREGEQGLHAAPGSNGHRTV